jgi:hypothetical protein
VPSRKPVQVGEKFGKLTVISSADPIPNKWGGNLYRVNAQCDCGRGIVVLESSLKSGNTKSCGCVFLSYSRSGKAARTHGMRKTSTYGIWAGMVQRCKNPNLPSFDAYGGRGILLCDRWRKFENFLADMGERPPGKTLDRIDNDGNYEPGNCRWATDAQQRANKRDSKLVMLDGEIMTTAEALRKIGWSPTRVLDRMRHHGCTRQEAIDYYANKRKSLA